MKIIAIGLNTFREAVRNKILYSIILFAGGIVLVSSLFGAVSIGDQVMVIKNFGLFSISFFGAIITIVSGVNLLNKELRRKTIYNILSKPVSRWQFITGKHLGLTATVWLLVILMGIFVIGFSAAFEGKVDWLMFQAVFLTLLEVTIIAAITLFFSSLVVTTTLTGLFTIATYIAGRSIQYLTYFTTKLDDSTGNVILKKTATVLDYILPDLSLFNSNNQIVYGEAISLQNIGLATAYSFSYSAIVLILASIIFQKRELN